MDDLELHSSPMELKLTWKNSPITIDYAIQYCIQVYQIMGDASMLVSSGCTVNRTSYVFSTNESEPDPNDLFQFIITPRYNVEGAKGGTPRNVSGYFVAGKIHAETIDMNYIGCILDPPALPQGSINVNVTIAQDLLVNLHITLYNAVSESPPLPW